MASNPQIFFDINYNSLIVLSIAINALKEASEYESKDDCNGQAGLICKEALNKIENYINKLEIDEKV